MLPDVNVAVKYGADNSICIGEGFFSGKGKLLQLGTFLDDFERRYAQFITSKIALCEKYEKTVSLY